MNKHERHFFGGGFSKVFPTPQFLSTPATGVDITDNSVRFLELEKVNYGKRIKLKGSYAITPGIIDHGKIVDKTKLIEILSKVKAENDITYIHASLPEEQAYLFQTTIPNTAIDKSQLQTILEFKLEENVPISSRDLIFDYEVATDTLRDEIILNITAFPYDIATDYLEVFDVAGFTPLSFEIDAQSVARAVIPKNHSGTYLVVDFGKMRTGIAIVSEEILRFTSTVSVGGDTLTQAIQKHFEVSEEEANKIKNEKGFAQYKDNAEALETLLTTVSILRDEISRHYTYWNTHTGENERDREKINKVILCGGSSNLAGLPEYLSSAMNVTVEVGNVWANTFSLNDFVPDIAYRDSLAYATAVGLALKSF